jgi:large subunit ribosomal protein L23
MRDRFRAVVRPLVTEKSSAAYGARKEYAFVCDPKANKYDIKDAIEALFEVRVTSVRTAMQRSKRKTMGRYAGRRPRWKKAFVMLHEDDSIEIFEG